MQFHRLYNLLQTSNTSLFLEDYQSSLSQATKIIKNNGFDESIISSIEQIYNSAPNTKKDNDLAVLAMLYVATQNLDQIRNEYYTYLNSPSAISKSLLPKFLVDVTNQIKSKKLFIPDKQEEKFKLIQSLATQLFAEIHKYQKATEVTGKKLEVDSDVVYQDDKITVYVADSKSKCIEHGKGSNLCISTRTGENYYWRYRMGHMRDDDLGMTTYFVYWNDESNKILIDSLGDEDGQADEYSWNTINPNNDKDISKEKLISKFPELEKPFTNNVFEFLPYNEKEKRFEEIEENISNIQELNSFEEYEMFIEADKDLLKDDWLWLASKLPDKQVAHLLVKYGGLENYIDQDIAEKYLSPSEIERYLDKINESDESDIQILVGYYWKNVNSDKKKILISYKNYLSRMASIENVLYSGTDDEGTYLHSINLNGQGLLFLPNLSFIKTVKGDFYCHNNKLTSLPESIGKMKIGGSFNCYDNKLTSLPDSISEMRIGGDFYCHNNKLTSLPESIGEMRIGGSFSCSNNQLTFLPKSIGNMKIGDDFYCHKNKLTSLPDSIGKMKIGGDFYCSNNQLTSLPDSIGKMKIGGSFICHDNKLTSLPESIGEMRIGGGFNCSHNKLTSLPESIGNMRIGGSFDCSENQLTSLPESIGNMKIGGGFDCSENQLTSLPESIGNMKIGGGFIANNNKIKNYVKPPQYSPEMKEWAKQFKEELRNEIKDNNLNLESFKEFFYHYYG